MRRSTVVALVRGVHGRWRAGGDVLAGEFEQYVGPASGLQGGGRASGASVR